MRVCWKVVTLEAAAVLLCSTVAFSQNHVPIIQDGTPAVMDQKPVPHTASGKPDLSGVWGVPSTDELKIIEAHVGRPLPGPFGSEASTPPSLTSWEKERYEYNLDARAVPGFAGSVSSPKADPKRFLTSEGGGMFGARPEMDPQYKCIPPGTGYLITGWGSVSPQEIIQSDKRVLMIYEFDHTIRQIWTDGRKHPDQVDLTWSGNSVGTWDGDTLVVDTVGLRNEFWLFGGYVASTKLHIIERYRRLDNDTLQIQFTFDDPKAFTKPWTRTEYRRLRPTWELLEDVRCYPGSPEQKADELLNQLFLEPN